MWREIETGDSKVEISDFDIIQLTNECYIRLKNPGLKRKVGLFAALVIGVFSAEVYIKPSQRATKDLSIAMSGLAVTSTVGINGVFNAYFNIDAIKELFYLSDPVTGRLSVPPIDVFLTMIVSIASALCMAFLDLADESLTSITKFGAQLANFTAQHYFGVMKLFKAVRATECCLRPGDQKIVQRKAHYAEKFDTALVHFSQSFYADSAGVKKYYNPEGVLDTEQLANDIIKMIPSSSSTSVSSYWTKGTVGLSQIVGFFGQIIGNLGYFNANVNGFLNWLPIIGAWIAASSSIIPFYILAFVVTYENINKISSVLINLVTRLVQGQYQQILDDLPYAIKRTPLFSLVSGLLLTGLGLFSFYSALGLMRESIYGGNEENPPRFEWVDTSARTFKSTYDFLTELVVVIFNIFPVPDLQNFLSTQLCYLLNRGDDRQVLQLLSVVEETGNRVTRIPVHVFREPRKPEFVDKQPRQSACNKIMNWLTCGFWGGNPSETVSINMGSTNYSQLKA